MELKTWPDIRDANCAILQASHITTCTCSFSRAAVLLNELRPLARRTRSTQHALNTFSPNEQTTRLNRDAFSQESQTQLQPKKKNPNLSPVLSGVQRTQNNHSTAIPPYTGSEVSADERYGRSRLHTGRGAWRHSRPRAPPAGSRRK